MLKIKNNKLQKNVSIVFKKMVHFTKKNWYISHITKWYINKEEWVHYK